MKFLQIKESAVAAAVAGVGTLALAPVLPGPAAVLVAVTAALLVAAALRQIRKPNPIEEASRPLANISHEIRTPLNGILGLTQLLIRMQPSAQQREYLEAIKSSGQSLLRLINDILDYSKMRSGALRFEHGPFPLRKWVRETVKGIAPQAHLAGLEVAFWVEPNVPDNLIGDPSRLRQALTNLLANAIKFTDEGEVSVEVSLAGRDRSHAILRFAVSDTGSGVPEKDRGRIFAPFTQGAPSRAAAVRGGGVGLGLAIVRDLVSQMGGSLGLEPRREGGSTFFFTARFEMAAGDPAGDTAPTDPIPGFDVLVVDGSPAHRGALEKQLAAWGFDVTVAADEASALAAVQRDRAFSLVLVDSNLSEGDFWTFAKKLQASHRSSGVLMTRAHEHVDTVVLREHGFLGNLTKPVAPTHLLRAIEIIRRGGAVAAPEDVHTSNMDRLALGGLRVLVAEDHPVNRTVLARMLERAGSHVSMVTNGREALELLERSRFDVALLDVQMPEVDGLALARAIRTREENTGEHLPLVAVTAHAREVDRERCLRAGMDAFISKPFQEEELISVMTQFVSSGAPTKRRPRFDRARALTRANGDEALLAEITNLFLEETPQTLAAIEAALAASDQKGVERLAHRLASALVMLSAERASELALELETSARTKSLAECAPLLEALASELSRLEDELQAVASETKSR